VFILIESPDSAFLDHLQSRLQSQGIQCLVTEPGPSAEGVPQFTIQLPLYSQMVAARRLLYRCPYFPSSIQPHFMETFLQLRQQQRHQLLAGLTSAWALRLSALCACLLLLGLAVEALLQ